MSNWVSTVFYIFLNAGLLLLTLYCHEKIILRKSREITNQLILEWIAISSHFFTGRRKMAITRSDGQVRINLIAVDDDGEDYSKTLQIINGKIEEIKDE